MTATHHPVEPGFIPEFTLGDRMAKALTVAGISRQEMAEYMDVSTETLRRWCAGESPVRKSSLRLWSMRTGVDLEWLQNGYAIRDSNPEPADRVCVVLAFPERRAA